MDDSTVNALLLCNAADKSESGTTDRFFTDLSHAFEQDDSVTAHLAVWAIPEDGNDLGPDEIGTVTVRPQVLIPVVTPRFLQSGNCINALIDFVDELAGPTAFWPILVGLPAELDWDKAGLAPMATMPAFSPGQLWSADSDPSTWGDFVRAVKAAVVYTGRAVKKATHPKSADNLPMQVEQGESPGMFQLNHQFLADLGLAWLPTADEKRFLRQIYSELEHRVGEALTDGMSDEMLDEFGYFVNMDTAGMATWFAKHLPDFETQDDFDALKTANPDASEAAVMSEYGAMQWLLLNRPDYPQVVADALQVMQQQIEASSSIIAAEYAGYPE